MGDYDQYLYSTGTHYVSNSGSDQGDPDPGDKSGQEWYLKQWEDYRNGGWNCVLRHPNNNVGATIAELGCAAALNDNIGYSQARNTTYLHQLEAVGWDPRKITEKCDDDCAAGVLANVIATGHLLNMPELTTVPTSWTGNVRSGLSAAGFSVLTDYETVHTCNKLLPGDVLLNDVHHAATNVTLSTGMSFSGVSGLTGAGTGSLANLHYEIIDDYIITIDENTKNPNYEDMMENRVSGVVIKAGCMWNSKHKKLNSVRNKYLQRQVNAAEELHLPYGFYWDCRAQTVSEADEEMYELMFIVREHPPDLGVWLHLEMNLGTKKKNDKIVDEYYNRLVYYGLKWDIGFYVTREELDTIHWENYQDDWWLWLVDHVEDLEEIETFLDPTFFMYDEEKAAELKSSIVAGGSSTYNYGDTSATYTAEENAVWDYLMGKINNAYGVAGIMGNWQKESGFIAANLENYYESITGWTDQTYTEAVDNGTYTNFGGDRYGYGLAQWTDQSRKPELLSFAKQRGTSIGCLSMQLDFFWEELQSKFGSTLSYLQTATSAYSAAVVFLSNFEMPGGLASEEPERGGNAETIYKRHAG